MQQSVASEQELTVIHQPALEVSNSSLELLGDAEMVEFELLRYLEFVKTP